MVMFRSVVDTDPYPDPGLGPETDLMGSLDPYPGSQSGSESGSRRANMTLDPDPYPDSLQMLDPDPQHC
jgi:hypothetical protein